MHGCDCEERLLHKAKEVLNAGDLALLGRESTHDGAPAYLKVESESMYEFMRDEGRVRVYMCMCLQTGALVCASTSVESRGTRTQARTRIIRTANALKIKMRRTRRALRTRVARNHRAM